MFQPRDRGAIAGAGGLITRAIGPFCRAKTCSTKARTFDFRPLAREIASGMGLPFGFLRWIWLRRPLSAKCFSFFADP